MKEKTKKKMEDKREEAEEESEWKEELRVNSSGWGRMLIIMGSLTLMVCFIGCVSAFGITPAKATVGFSPGLERGISFNVVNSEHKDINLSISKGGELADYITIYNNSISMGAGEGLKEVSYRINLPMTLSPGLHNGEVRISEVQPSGGAQFSTLTAVSMQIVVKVPYPGKYIEAGVSIEDARAGENTTIRIPLLNAGSERINNAGAVIDIYDKTGNLVKDVSTEGISLDAGERKDILGVWESKVPAGNYRAVVKISYDGKNLTLEKEFSLGIVELKIESINLGRFELGGIARIDLIVKNQWDGEIKNLHSRILIFNNDGAKIKEFYSPDLNVNPMESAMVTSYLESSGMDEGDYNATIYLESEKMSLKENIIFTLRENEISADGLKQGSIDSTDVIKVILIIFAILAVCWMVGRRFGKSRNR